MDMVVAEEVVMVSQTLAAKSGVSGTAVVEVVEAADVNESGRAGSGGSGIVLIAYPT